MEWIGLPPRGHRFDSSINISHTLVVLLFVATTLTWLLVAFSIHNFATLTPDAAHSIPVHEHGGTFFLGRALDRLYVNMPWIWLTTLGASIVITVLRSKFEKKAE